MADTSTPSGLPLDLKAASEEVDFELEERQPLTRSEQRDERPARARKPEARSNPSEDDEDGGGDDELDEIIDRVIEVVKARRAGVPVPPRRTNGSTALGAPSTVKTNPSTQTLVYAGLGVGAVALIGGLWYYFRKKE